eukprot:scaffold177_cov334-Pavlova_lutheri.AAC.7
MNVRVERIAQQHARKPGVQCRDERSLRIGTYSSGNSVGEDAMNCPSLMYVAPSFSKSLLRACGAEKVRSAASSDASSRVACATCTVLRNPLGPVCMVISASSWTSWSPSSALWAASWADLPPFGTSLVVEEAALAFPTPLLRQFLPTAVL